MSTGIYFGRFQPLHDGHAACIEKILSEHDTCLVLVRDTNQTENNPFNYEQRKEMIRKRFPDESKVKILPVHDPDADLTVYIGRKVGYGLIQLDKETESISATDIRKKLYEEK